MHVRARVTSKGQVTIPRDVRRALQIETGDTVIFDITDGGVRLRPLHAGKVSAFAGSARKGTGKTVAEIVAEARSLRGC